MVTPEWSASKHLSQHWCLQLHPDLQESSKFPFTEPASNIKSKLPFLFSNSMSLLPSQTFCRLNKLEACFPCFTLNWWTCHFHSHFAQLHALYFHVGFADPEIFTSWIFLFIFLFYVALHFWPIAAHFMFLFIARFFVVFDFLFCFLLCQCLIHLAGISAGRPLWTLCDIQ